MPAPPVHTPPTAFSTVPCSDTAGLLVHTCWSGPASGRGFGLKVSTIWSCWGVQEPVEVSVRVTVPRARSPMLGSYVAFRLVALGWKVPLPLVVHLPVVLPPVTVPPRVAFIPAQSAWSGPAFTSILPENSEKKP